MKFTGWKSSSQRGLDAVAKREKCQFKLLVNSCWAGYWSANKAEASPLAFTFVVLSLDVHYPSRTLFSKAGTALYYGFISNWTLTVLGWDASGTGWEALKCFCCAKYFCIFCLSEHYLFLLSLLYWSFFFQLLSVISKLLFPMPEKLQEYCLFYKSVEASFQKWMLWVHSPQRKVKASFYVLDV